MKREAMKWLRSAEAGRMSVREEEVAEDILAELKRLRRIERATRALVHKRAVLGTQFTEGALVAALKKGGRK